MSKNLPSVIEFGNDVIEGKNVRTLIFSDHSVGIVTDVIERYLPDGTVQHFVPYKYVREVNHDPDPDYYDSGCRGEGVVWDEYRSKIRIESSNRSDFNPNSVDCALVYEKLPDQTERKYDLYGRLEELRSPNDNTLTKYFGLEICYHSTNGVEDTIAYLAKERIKNKKEQKLAETKYKSKIIQKLTGRIADSKVFNNIALKVATRKIKQK